METVKQKTKLLLSVLAIAGMLLFTLSGNAGSLNPSAPPGPTMKTLDEVEARIPIKATDLPLTISSSGSYYLAETINFATQNTNGITISVSDVTIDLNGYALIGPGKTTGSSGIGIYASGQRVTVLNGSVCQWRGDGIQLGGIANQVRYVKSSDNGGQGINVQKVSSVNNCTVTSNNGNGIYAWDGSIVTDCISYENNGNGIHGRMGVVVKGCSIYQNETSEGLSVGEGSAVDNCSIIQNWDGDGILAGYGSVITNCSVYDNDDGIMGGRYLTIKGCNFRDNGSYGIDTCDSLIYGNSSTGHSNNLTSCNNSAWNNHAP